MSSHACQLCHTVNCLSTQFSHRVMEWFVCLIYAWDQKLWFQLCTRWPYLCSTPPPYVVRNMELPPTLINRQSLSLSTRKCFVIFKMISYQKTIFFSIFIILLFWICLSQEEIYCTSYAVAYYLKEILKFDKKVFTIGTTGMVEELDALNIPHTGSGVGLIWLIIDLLWAVSF